MKKVIIIGAGPAGITAGYELLKKSSEYDVKILEESPYIGGISRTVEYKGHRMDLGGHRFFSKSQEVNDWWQEIMPEQGAPSYDDIKLKREVPIAPGGPNPEKEDRVMLTRNRVSRIYYDKKFFDYPVKLNANTIKNMGFGTTMNAGFSYLGSMVSKKKEDSLENFYINQFGEKLYSMFFEGYTEKLWGRHPSEIDPSWGAQRTKGLSISTVLKEAATKALHKESKEVVTSLIEAFKYPKLGPGQLWETAADEFVKKGGTIKKNAKVTKINTADGKVKSIVYEVKGRKVTEDADIVISSMPIKDLIEGMNNVPENVAEVAAGLPYRDFVTVGLLVPNLSIKNTTKMKTLSNIVPDTWIYVQDTGVKMGRIQIFNNWSPYLLEDPQNTVWIGLEYFCNEGDRYWKMSEDEWVSLASKELIHMGILSECTPIFDHHKVTVKKAYPAYFDTYDRFDEVRDYLDKFSNLYCVGRNGQHRYNNMDHSMITAFETVRNILSGNADKTNIWNVNTEQEYHEEKTGQSTNGGTKSVQSTVGMSQLPVEKVAVLDSSSEKLFEEGDVELNGAIPERRPRTMSMPVKEVIEEVIIEEPVVEENVAEEPVTEEVAEESVAEEPVIEEVAEAPVTEDVIEEVETEEVAEEIMTKEVSEEVVPEEPEIEEATKAPVAEEPSGLVIAVKSADDIMPMEQPETNRVLRRMSTPVKNTVEAESVVAAESENETVLAPEESKESEPELVIAVKSEDDIVPMDTAETHRVLRRMSTPVKPAVEADKKEEPVKVIESEPVVFRRVTSIADTEKKETPATVAVDFFAKEDVNSENEADKTPMFRRVERFSDTGANVNEPVIAVDFFAKEDNYKKETNVLFDEKIEIEKEMPILSVAVKSAEEFTEQDEPVVLRQPRRVSAPGVRVETQAEEVTEVVPKEVEAEEIAAVVSEEMEPEEVAEVVSEEAEETEPAENVTETEEPAEVEETEGTVAEGTENVEPVTEAEPENSDFKIVRADNMIPLLAVEKEDRHSFGTTSDTTAIQQEFEPSASIIKQERVSLIDVVVDSDYTVEEENSAKMQYGAMENAQSESGENFSRSSKMVVIKPVESIFSGAKIGEDELQPMEHDAISENDNIPKGFSVVKRERRSITAAGAASMDTTLSNQEDSMIVKSTEKVAVSSVGFVDPQFGKVNLTSTDDVVYEQAVKEQEQSAGV